MYRMLQSKRLLIVCLIILANLILMVKYNSISSQSEQSIRVAANKLVFQPLSARARSVSSSQQSFHLPPVIIYNRVPKTGSTTFANIAYDLSLQNRFNVLHINTTYKNTHWLSVLDQARFVQNVSEWREKQPAIYHGHVHFLDFTRFGYSNPIYINIIREPLQRLISYYYFLRYGDDYRPHLKRARAHDTTTLDECIEASGKDCNLERVLWVQVPFFCGQDAACLTPSRFALERAKTNLLSNYLLVGVTEQLGDFVALLEAILPSYFKGAYEIYEGDRGHLRRTQGKRQPSDETIKRIEESEVYRLEVEFYQFAKEQFEFLKQKAIALNKHGGGFRIQTPLFRYEKIVP